MGQHSPENCWLISHNFIIHHLQNTLIQHYILTTLILPLLKHEFVYTTVLSSTLVYFLWSVASIFQVLSKLPFFSLCLCTELSILSYPTYVMLEVIAVLYTYHNIHLFTVNKWSVSHNLPKCKTLD